jgi:uncharacterized membrane protein YeaQ/YmgE (transglycosylase-associated protein family)
MISPQFTGWRATMLWELSTVEWITSFGFICCFTYICGWLAEGLLQSSGFGHIGNWLLLLIGSYTAMYVFNIYGFEFRHNPVFTLGYVSAGAGGFFLLMCISKRVLIR